MKKFFTLERNESILKIAALLHIAVGLFIAFLPQVFLDLVGVEMSSGVEFLQCIGLGAIAAGIAYFSARTDIGRHWPIILVGLFGTFSSSILFLKALLMGSLPFGLALFAMLSSLAWIIPLMFILIYAYDVNTAESDEAMDFDDIVKQVRTSQNKSLAELSKEQPVLLMVVRHLGCVFCKDTVAELAKIENVLKEKNITPVFVHMSDLDFGDEFFGKYYPGPVHHISDPARNIYKSLNLKRAKFFEMFGIMTWLGTLNSGLIRGHGVFSEFEGDILQLGGMFVLKNGKIVTEYRAKSTSHLLRFNNLSHF